MERLPLTPVIGQCQKCGIALTVGHICIHERGKAIADKHRDELKQLMQKHFESSDPNTELKALADRLEALRDSLRGSARTHLLVEVENIESQLRAHAEREAQEEARFQEMADSVLSGETNWPPKGRFTPGITAIHTLITPNCRNVRGNTGAIGEALARVVDEYEKINDVRTDDYQFHLVLTVEPLPAPPTHETEKPE